MTRISQVDQMLMLLRQQLQGMTKAERSRRGARTEQATPQARKSAAKRIEALARAGGLDEDDLARSLIGALLVDEFGESVANDHKFRKMVDEVHRIVSSDPKARTMLTDALRKVGGEG